MNKTKNSTRRHFTPQEKVCSESCALPPATFCRLDWNKMPVYVRGQQP